MLWENCRCCCCCCCCNAAMLLLLLQCCNVATATKAAKCRQSGRKRRRCRRGSEGSPSRPFQWPSPRALVLKLVTWPSLRMPFVPINSNGLANGAATAFAVCERSIWLLNLTIRIYQWASISRRRSLRFNCVSLPREVISCFPDFPPFLLVQPATN